MPYNVMRFESSAIMQDDRTNLAPHELVGVIHALEDFYTEYDPENKYIMARVEGGWFAIHPQDEDINIPAYLLQSMPF